METKYRVMFEDGVVNIYIAWHEYPEPVLTLDYVNNKNSLLLSLVKKYYHNAVVSRFGVEILRKIL